MWIIAFILITTVLNIIGLKVTARANYLLVAFQLLVLGIFVALSIGYFIGEDTGASLASPFINQDITVSALAAGAAVRLTPLSGSMVSLCSPRRPTIRVARYHVP